ncbi:hypothetical protein V5O48_000256 [Marasmius crinis-equi]|uniref:Gustatory receptor n=1 Tax=Marasmius crinis-equi TaxID=585013 RepID=A0ABR3G1Q7_9AGAR
MAPIPLDKAYLTAIWLETLFYGINISLFFSYLFIARYKRKTRTIQPVILGTAIAMFIFSTIHCSMGFSRLIIGFIELRNQEGGPGAFFSDVSVPANVAKVTIHTVNSVLGDSIMVWRCYHVWGRNLLVSAVPILLIIGSAVCGFGQSVMFANAKHLHSAFEIELEHWNGSVFILSLVTNIVVTSLIAVRIWSVLYPCRKSIGDKRITLTESFNVNRYLGRQFSLSKTFVNYQRILVLIIESGAIYSSALIIEITLYFLGSNAFYIVYDPIAQLAAIVPTMIIVMTSLGLTSNDLNSAATRAASGGPSGSSGPRGATSIVLESRPQFAARTLTSTIGGPYSTTDYGVENVEKDGMVKV